MAKKAGSAKKRSEAAKKAAATRKKNAAAKAKAEAEAEAAAKKKIAAAKRAATIAAKKEAAAAAEKAAKRAAAAKKAAATRAAKKKAADAAAAAKAKEAAEKAAMDAKRRPGLVFASEQADPSLSNKMRKRATTSTAASRVEAKSDVSKVMNKAVKESRGAKSTADKRKKAFHKRWTEGASPSTVEEYAWAREFLNS